MPLPYEVCASRTNLSSRRVCVHRHHEVGEGKFRIAYAGTYIGGIRNQQEAVCKKFKNRFKVIEREFFACDMKIADIAIDLALQWNRMCKPGTEIIVTKGTVHEIHGRYGVETYLVEPLIRHFTKFTSNSGWVASPNDEGWAVLAMEAFSHYTYHKTGGHLIVCDLQGRHRNDWHSGKRCRFELTDPAICSRRRKFGPTDLGLKGIESFFHNHICNPYCNHDGYWQKPARTQQWFPLSHGTSMLASSEGHRLSMQYRTRFQPGFMDIMEEDDQGDY